MFIIFRLNFIENLKKFKTKIECIFPTNDKQDFLEEWMINMKSSLIDTYLQNEMKIKGNKICYTLFTSQTISECIYDIMFLLQKNDWNVININYTNKSSFLIFNKVIINFKNIIQKINESVESMNFKFENKNDNEILDDMDDYDDIESAHKSIIKSKL